MKKITGLSLPLTPKLSVPEAFQSEGLVFFEGSSWTSGSREYREASAQKSDSSSVLPLTTEAAEDRSSF